jgi:hypothetical protein
MAWRLYKKWWFLHRRDEKTVTKWSLEEERSDRGALKSVP